MWDQTFIIEKILEVVSMKKNYLIKESVSNKWIDEVIQLSQGEVYCIQGGLNDAYLIDFRGVALWTCTT